MNLVYALIITHALGSVELYHTYQRVDDCVSAAALFTLADKVGDKFECDTLQTEEI